MRMGALLSALLGFSACAADVPARRFVMRCGDGTVLSVVYDADFSALTVGGEGGARLHQARAASGARYTGEGREFWEKAGTVRWTAGAGAPVACRLAPEVGLPNPAAVHCTEAGGRPVTERRPDGSEFGVCLFSDNRQCGQWALFRGECPAGGRRVAGYPTDAARFCGITGGQYAETAAGAVCVTPSGRVCGVEAYDRGSCR